MIGFLFDVFSFLFDVLNHKVFFYRKARKALRKAFEPQRFDNIIKSSNYFRVVQKTNTNPSH